MERALAKLRPVEREVLMLNAREGLGLTDIAIRLGLPLAAVRGHLADALCRLDRLLQPRRRWYWPW
jgi:DNA-directed RNA polymerase specialized sigma24 family protein